MSGNSSAVDEDGGGWPALVAAGLSGAVLLIDIFIVAVASADLIAAFSMPPAQMGWIIGAFSLPLASLPLVTGAAGDQYGVRRIYAIGAAIFIAGSICGALSGTVYELAGSRMLQGCGAAMMFPQTLSAASRSLGPARRGFAVGVWGSLSALGLLSAPLVGGALLTYWGWKAIFLVNVPLGLATIVAISATVPSGPRLMTTRRFPWTSVFLLVSGMGALVYFIEAALRGSAGGVVGVAGAVALLLTWLRRERRGVGRTLVGRELLADTAFGTACLAAATINASVFGSVSVINLAVEHAPWAGSHAALWTGFVYVPAMIAVALSMPAAGALAQKRTPSSGAVLLAGAALVAGGPLALVLCSVEPDLFQAPVLAAILLAQGFGGGIVLSYAMVAALSSTGANQSGLGSGALAMSRNAGTAIGAAIITALAEAAPRQSASFLAAAILSLLMAPFLWRCLTTLRQAKAARPAEALVR